MLGFGSNAAQRECWETDYDRFQHYFYDGDDSEEDFYKSTAPSEDIWKKFELVLTPPLSPARTADAGGTTYPSPGDELEWVTQLLGQNEEQEGQYCIDTNEIFGNLSSIINQDCMWSGFSANQRLEKVVSERLSGTAPTKTPPGVQTSVHDGSRSLDSQLVGTLATDCVDPAAVFTYPYCNTISSKKQASSGSESRSDSSDDEEIDVVTVDSKQKKNRSATGGGRKPVTITVRADPHDPEMKHFHISIHRQQHNYAAPSPASDTEGDERHEAPPAKRARRQPYYLPRPGSSGPSPAERTAFVSAPAANPAPNPTCVTDSAHLAPSARDSAPDSASSASPTDSPQSSDSEDTDKRRAHNFLERKRRNDLRSRFLALRDQIPGLASSAKTPKVAILTQAVEYLRQLRAADRRASQERRQLRARQRQLLGRLAQLKRT